MEDLIRDPISHTISRLKAHARILHTQIQKSDPAALRRARTLPELKKVTAEDVPIEVKRRHCLAIVARELGFEGWPHAVTVLTSDHEVDDFGTLLYLGASPAQWNIWSASYEEAKAIRQEHGGYLLAYKRQFLIVDRHYIETIGLDPEHADWERIGRDWVKPSEPRARRELYAKLIERRWAVMQGAA